MYGDRADEALHEKFAREGEDDDVEAHEGNVGETFAVVRRYVGIIAGMGGYQRVAAGKGVAEEESAVERVGFGGIDGVEKENDGDDDERVDPGVFEGIDFPPTDVGSDSSSFRGSWNETGGRALAVSQLLTQYLSLCAILTGERGGETIVGIGSRVETAGPPVSPRGSPVRPDDFRRGRAMMCAWEMKLMQLQAEMWAFAVGRGRFFQ